MFGIMPAGEGGSSQGKEAGTIRFQIAEALARGGGGEYNPHHGADVVTGLEAIEIEIEVDIS
jgi:hypothetical protein